MLENVKFAGDKGLPICQDTGTPVFYVHVGRSTKIDFDIKQALYIAVQKATELISLRKNAVNPLTREIEDKPLLEVIYEIVGGDQIVVWKLKVENFGPLMVAIDSYLRSLYKEVETYSNRKLHELLG